MMHSLSQLEQLHWPYISTGHLPEADTVQDLVREAHARFRSNTEGENSQVYPALARVPSDQRFGPSRVFRAAVVVFCAAQILMTLSPSATLMITAQGLAGASAALIVPALVALIAENYRGRQQATAVGALGSARAAAGVLAFIIGPANCRIRRCGEQTDGRFEPGGRSRCMRSITPRASAAVRSRLRRY